MRKKTIIFCTVGTRGDFIPFEALAKTFVALGHRVIFLANENWRNAAQATGATFMPVAEEDPPQSGRNDARFFTQNLMPSFQRSYDIVRAEVERGNSPLLVTRSNMLGMDCAAEKYDLDLVRICLQPCAIKSFDRPPWPWTSFATGRWRLLYKLAVSPAIALMETTGRYRRQTNRFRRSIGLRPKFFHVPRDERNLNIILCPEWFSMPGSDWPQQHFCVGFPILPAPPLDSELDAFLDAHTPLVFTPGTGVTDVSEFFAKAEEVSRQLNLAALFLSPFCKSKSENPNVMHRDFADLGAVLSRARLLVHHGGIGSTAQALRAGIPQVIIPDRFDQPDNAMRIARLGLGGVILDKSMDASAWTSLIRPLLTNEQLHVRLGRVAQAIHCDNAIANAVELILGRTRPALP